MSGFKKSPEQEARVKDAMSVFENNETLEFVSENMLMKHSEEARISKPWKPNLQMFVPKLIFADSALWMWILQLNIKKSHEENNRVWKDLFFRTDPAIDYNN